MIRILQAKVLWQGRWGPLGIPWGSLGVLWGHLEVLKGPVGSFGGPLGILWVPVGIIIRALANYSYFIGKLFGACSKRALREHISATRRA
jgi:hypothetical protein